MKYLFLLLIGLPVSLFAQDCRIKKEKDQFSQQERLTTGFIQLTNCRLSITADSKELDFLFSLGPDKCFDENSTLTVVYDDGHTKTNLRNTGSMNCEGLFHFTVRNTTTTNYNLDRLTTKKVKAFVLTNANVTTTVLLNPDQQQMIQTAAGCMAKEAKTLIAQP